MAVELTRKNLKELFANRGAPVTVPVRVLTAICVFAVAVSMASVFVAIHNAHRDEAAARQRYADARALVALPPLSTESLKEDLASAKATLATAQAVVAVPTGTVVAADDPTALLVTRAQAAGLTVKGITRNVPGQSKLGDTSYDVQGVHVIVEAKPEKITAFLADLGASQPSLVPSLTSLTVNDAGIAHAEISFSTYAAIPTPTVAPRPTPKAKK